MSDAGSSGGPPGTSYQRDESEAHRLDRNYSELLQELRVAQTGVQILFAFLLGIPFQSRFPKLHTYQRDMYLATLICAAIAMVLLIAPAALHRVLFRRHLKDEVVTYSSRLAGAGLVFLALAVLSAVLFVVDVVLGVGATAAVTGVLALTFLITWVIIPLRARSKAPR